MEINKLVQENLRNIFREDNPKAENFGQSPRPIDSTLSTALVKNLIGGYRVIYRTGTKRITLYRFFLAKLVYDEVGLGIDDLLTLYDLSQYLILKNDRDPEFQNKYGSWLITTFHVIRNIAEARNFPIRPGIQSKQFMKDFLKPYLPSPQAYFGYKKNPKIIKSYSVKLRNPLPLQKAISQRRVIGVGYRDKGYRKDPAKDGSPHWKEVSSANPGEEIKSSSTIQHLKKLELEMKNPMPNWNN